MSVTKTTAHASTGLGWLVKQFKGQPRLQALLSALLNQVQSLEDATWDLLMNRWLDTAVGAQLDALGKIVGEPRNGRNDADYKVRLQARLRINLASGTPEDVLALFSFLLPSNTFKIKEWYPAHFTLEIFGAMTANISELSLILQTVKAAAVGTEMIYSLAADEDTFTFADGATMQVDSGRGYADAAMTTGGVYAGVV